MKNVLLFIFIVIISFGLSAQDLGFNYQTVVRNSNGIVANQNVAITFIVTTKSHVLVEEHQVTTDEHGLINLVIGSGTPSAFKDFDWSDGNATIQVKMVVDNETIDTGAKPLQAVPYAFYVPGLKTKDIVNIKEADAENGDVLLYDDGDWISTPLQDRDNQTLSLSGTTLSISNGNSINLNEITTGGDGWGSQLAETEGRIDGDGTSSNPIQLSTTNVSEGEYLTFDGSQWQTSDYHGVEKILAGSGMQVFDNDNGETTVAALRYDALWNAEKLRGNTITAEQPSDGQVLVYNQSQQQWGLGVLPAETGWIKEYIGSGSDGYWRNYTDYKTFINHYLEVEYNISTNNQISAWGDGYNTLRGNTVLGPGFGNATLSVTGGSDISLGDNSGGVLTVGDISGNHLAMDGNEIMAKGSGSSEGTLFLQVEGGSVKVGGGASYPSHIFQVGGIARSTQSTWATSSDERVKRNIHGFPYGLKDILALRPVQFDWKDIYKKENKGLKDGKLGFIAQEVEKIIPEMVSTHEEHIGNESIKDFRSINMDPLFPALVQAVKDQQKLIDEQQKRIDDLEILVKKLIQKK